MFSRKSILIAFAISTGLLLAHFLFQYKDLSSRSRDQDHKVVRVAARVGVEQVRPAGLWLDQHRMLFGRRSEQLHGRYRSWSFAAYDVERREWDFLEGMTEHHVCADYEAIVLVRPSRLPDGTIGYFLRCLRGRPSYYLYTWNERSDDIELYFDFQKDFQKSRHESALDPGAYTFSPDMSELVFALVNIADGKLYHVQGDGQIVPFAPQIVRAIAPRWSPDGTAIAFLGSEAYDGGPPEEVLSFVDTIKNMRGARDLFVVNPNGENVRRVAGGFIETFKLQWLPRSNRHLLLAGKYRVLPWVWWPRKWPPGLFREGIWLIDVETGRMTRIWDKHDPFSFTPDGEQFAILDGYAQVSSTLEGRDTVEEWTALLFDSSRIIPAPAEVPWWSRIPVR